MKYLRIDAFDTVLAESAVLEEFKLGTTGTGERRIYCGTDKDYLDAFFDWGTRIDFVFLKSDLEKYISEAQIEYLHPSQNYSNVLLSSVYREKERQTHELSKDNYVLHFRRTYDDQNRYFLVLNDKKSRENWNHVLNIALPRLTHIHFYKMKNDVDPAKIIIYIKPAFYRDENNIEFQKSLRYYFRDFDGTFDSFKEKYARAEEKWRKKQAKFRKSLLKKMPQCVISNIKDDCALEACHIKPFSQCAANEKYDENNGLILTPTLHALFDKGFISFSNEKRLRISPSLSEDCKAKLNLIENTKCDGIPDECLQYLSMHQFENEGQEIDVEIRLRRG